MTQPGGQFGLGDRAPDLTEPVIGYRGWFFDTDRRMLRSTLARVWWDSPEAWAKCIVVGPAWSRARPAILPRLRHPHRPPGHRCSCGLYSYYEHIEHGHVQGAVVNTGRIEVHRSGMRAEQCRVVALAEPREPHSRDSADESMLSVVRRIAAEWGVPCVPASQLAQLTAEWGEPMPETLRPV